MFADDHSPSASKDAFPPAADVQALDDAPDRGADPAVDAERQPVPGGGDGGAGVSDRKSFSIG